MTGRVGRLAVLAVSMALAVGAGGLVSDPGVAAQSPPPDPAPTASAEPSASLWPDAAPTPAFEPSGPPHATVTHDGVVLDLWLSSTSVASGQPVEAVVRVTNTRRDAVWSSDHPCAGEAGVSADLSAVLDPGVVAVGNAAELKRRVADDPDNLHGAFERVSSRRLPGDEGIVVTVLADCAMVGESFRRLGPGRTIEQRWSWTPQDPLDAEAGWFRPLPPGPVPVTATWRYVGHGSRASVRADRRPATPLTVTATLALTGTDPGLLSPLELVDRALADPDFAAWVDADPTQADWVGAWVDGWQVTDLPPRPRFAGLAELAPNGVVEVALARDLPGRPGVFGSAWVDPWTGEVVRFTTE